MGLTEYNPVAIARVTHGILTDDYTWNDVNYWKEG